MGHERASPGQFDGYLTQEPNDRWQVAARGVVIGEFEEEEQARAVLSEHAAGLPCWKVVEGREAVRISV